jgi:hypothetical protein
MNVTTHVANNLYHAHQFEPLTGLFQYLALFLVVGLLSGVVLLIVSRFVVMGLIIFIFLLR